MNILPHILAPYEQLLPQDNATCRIDALLDLARPDQATPDALNLLHHARTLALELPDEARTAQCELQLAQLLEGDRALEYVRIARIRFERIRNVTGEAQGTLREAELLMAHPAEALTACLVGAHLAHDAQQPTLQAQAWRRAGDLYNQLGGGQEATHAYEQALAISGEPQPQAADIPTLLALGSLYLKTQKVEQALGVYRSAGHLSKKESTVEYADALAGLGSAYGMQGELERALKFLEAATQLASRHADHCRHSRFLNLMASVHDEQDEPDQAKRYFDQSLKLAQSSGLTDAQAVTRLDLAEHHLRRAEWTEAATHLRQVHELCGHAQLGHAERRAHHLMVRLAKAQGDPSTALIHHEAWSGLEQGALDAMHQKHLLRQKAELQAQSHLDMRRDRLEMSGRLEASLNEAMTRTAELHAQADTWRDTSMFDPVSGARSSRYGAEQLELNFKRSLRAKTALSLAIVGVDMALENADGPVELHSDGVLRTVASVLSNTLRGTDTVARFDQQKFMVIFPETEAAGATLTLQRVLDALGQHQWESQGFGAPASVSIGLASRGYLQWSQLLLEAADQEHYRARRAGKNVLSVAE